MDRKITNSSLIALCSELAEDRAIEENIEEARVMRNEDINIYRIDQETFEETEQYTKEFQQIYTKWYDYFYNIIIKFSNEI